MLCKQQVAQWATIAHLTANVQHFTAIYLVSELKSEHSRQKTTFSPLQVNGKSLYSNLFGVRAKTEHARQKTTLQVNGKVFRQSNVSNSEGNGQTKPDLQLVRDFILVLITNKFYEDLIIRPVAGQGSSSPIAHFLSEAF